MNYNLFMDDTFRAVEIVLARLRRTVEILAASEVPYAVIGDHAVSAWIARVDESAVRNTFRVEVLVSRAALENASQSLIDAGFFKLDDLRFLEQPGDRPRNAVQLFMACEAVRAKDPWPAPAVSDNEFVNEMNVIALDPLVRMLLVANGRNDKVNVRDLIDVGLVDAIWLPRLPAELAARLQYLIDTPEG